MLATITLATKEPWFAVWLGSTIGMVAADALAIVVGQQLGSRLPERAIRIGATLAFVVLRRAPAGGGGRRLTAAPAPVERRGPRAIIDPCPCRPRRARSPTLASRFDLPDEVAYLNCAFMGPMPVASIEAGAPAWPARAGPGRSLLTTSPSRSTGCGPGSPTSSAPPATGTAWRSRRRCPTASPPRPPTSPSTPARSPSCCTSSSRATSTAGRCWPSAAAAHCTSSTRPPTGTGPQPCCKRSTSSATGSAWSRRHRATGSTVAASTWPRCPWRPARSGRPSPSTSASRSVPSRSTSARSVRTSSSAPPTSGCSGPTASGSSGRRRTAARGSRSSTAGPAGPTATAWRASPTTPASTSPVRGGSTSARWRTSPWSRRPRRRST